jgi:CelD/BcsL family acetyltransferase involved in cellulose biosynthesis
MLRVELVREWSGLARHARAWNELLRASASDCVFLTWEWVDTWWQVYGDLFELHALVVLDGGELCGVAPLMLRRGAGPVGRPFRTLMYIGQEVDVTPEYLDLFARRGREREVAAAVVGELCGRSDADTWEHLSLERVLTSSPFLPLLEQELRARGVAAARSSAELDSPYATLAPSWEQFLAARSSGFRRQHRNKRNRLERAGALALRFAARDVGIAEALAHVVRLNRERWQEAGQSFRSERYARFHQRFCERVEPLGWLALCLLELDGKVIAGRYDYLYGDKLWCYQGGWDPAHKELNVGDNLIGMVIEWGIARGVREYDFLGGAAAYKDRWSDGHRALVDLRGYNTTARARAFELLRRARSLAREAAPRARALLGKLRG